MIGPRTKRKLLSKPNVVSVGVGLKNGTGEPCVVVGVVRKVPAETLKRREKVPKKLGRATTDVVEVGTIKLLARTWRDRPVHPGTSIGHVNITAGTFGCLVEDTNKVEYILSNNHVLADVNQAEIGDPILQPGPVDGGKYPGDQIANLHQYEPILFEGEPTQCQYTDIVEKVLNWTLGVVGSKQRFKATTTTANLFDAALALPTGSAEVSDEIIDLGQPAGVSVAALGTSIMKSGRTTNTTQGTVTQVDATVQVDMGQGRTALFEDQVFSDIHSDGGDSGSAILDEGGKVVGLLFAGGGGVTVLCRIEHILGAFGVSVSTDV